jgi:hypothetical protein
MLKHLKKHWRSWVVGSLIVTAFLVIAMTSDTFQECMNHRYYESSDYEPKKGITKIFILLGWTKTCAGEFLRVDGEAVTAFFTLVLSVSTIALWLSTRKAADAAREAAEFIPSVERAYIFVEPKISTTTSFDIFDNSKIGPNAIGTSYVFTNHGKTPAIIQSIEVHFDFWTDAPDNSHHVQSKILGGEIILKAGESTGRDTESFAREFDVVA